eukprot:6210049-Pleurochrysis_carterae.AAC.3
MHASRACACASDACALASERASECLREDASECACAVRAAVPEQGVFHNCESVWLLACAPPIPEAFQ